MALREFCDRCGTDVTGEQTGALHGGDDTDRDGNGTMNDHFDILCLSCYKEILAFIRQRPSRRKPQKVSAA